MSLPRRAAIAGLGLMGGSLARALARRGVEVWATDRDPAALDRALAEGVVRHLPEGDLPGLELLVLAVPVTAAPAVLEALLPRLPPECVVTDLGSTKASLAAAAARLGIAERFVGSHPMAGDHRSGWEAAREDLFTGAAVYLCPTPATHPAALARVRELWVGLAGRPQLLDPAAHDQLLAWTSHLPQITSSMLAGTLAAAGIARDVLGPGGRDTTRLAGSSPEMWSAICLDNAARLEPALAALEGALRDFRDALRDGDAGRVRAALSAAHAWTRAEPAE